jgi:O-antigen/teichoic acid export membrane protein
LLLKNNKLLYNFGLNLIGNIIPLIIGVITIPLLLEGLGNEKFGLLNLIWISIGYLSVFDFGISRALTQLIAKNIDDEELNINSLIWTSFFIMIILSIIATVLILLTTSKLVDFISISENLKDEVKNTIYIIALSMPIVITSTGLKGLLEAVQRFDLANLIRVPYGIYTFIAPLIVMQFYTTRMDVIVAVLILGRFINWVFYVFACKFSYKSYITVPNLDFSLIKTLISFGGWVTVGSTVGPIMLYLDRLIVAALVPISIVAFYTTPYEMVTKLFIISGAITAVMFPVFSKTFTKNVEDTYQYYRKGLDLLALCMIPIVVIILFFVEEGLTLWLGTDFAINSSTLTKVIIVGVLFLALESIPFALLQASGRPDLPAKINLYELPIYLLSLWLMVKHFGLVGGAITWLVRAIIDYGILKYYALKLMKKGLKFSDISPIIYLLVTFILSYNIENIVIKIIISIMLILTLLINKRELFTTGQISKKIFGYKGS